GLQRRRKKRPPLLQQGPRTSADVGFEQQGGDRRRFDWRGLEPLAAPRHERRLMATAAARCGDLSHRYSMRGVRSGRTLAAGGSIAKRQPRHSPFALASGRSHEMSPDITMIPSSPSTCLEKLVKSKTM